MIDLGKIVQAAVGSVKSSIGGAVKTATYRHAVGEAEYDPVTGDSGPTYTDYTLTNVILTSFKFNERSVDASILKRPIEAGDQKLLVPFADLPVTPTLRDAVVLGGETWEVVNFALDPSQTALHTIQIKRI